MPRSVAIVLILLPVVAACAGSSPPTTTPPVSEAPSAPDDPAPTTSGGPLSAAPPTASLAAEGGDPVVGQLGTYVWRDGGSDSPWLPGARISVGSGEPMTVALDPSVGIASWTARYVPASAGGPDGAVGLGAGVGPPAFIAPGPGAWTVEVHVVFGGALGDASYFWRLEVT